MLLQALHNSTGLLRRCGCETCLRLSSWFCALVWCLTELRCVEFCVKITVHHDQSVRRLLRAWPLRSVALAKWWSHAKDLYGFVVLSKLYKGRYQKLSL